LKSRGSQLVGVEGLSLAGPGNAQKSGEQPELGFGLGPRIAARACIFGKTSLVSS